MSVLRMLLVTLFATVSGAMLGALIGGIHPLGGLTMMPLTLLACLCLLLPAHLWSRRVKRLTKAKTYLVVVASGAFGGSAALVLVSGLLGRLAGDISGEMLRLLPIGIGFGGATAICWVAGHHLIGFSGRPTQIR